MRIGFIGLGHMGRHMATNILRANHELMINDLDESAGYDLVMRGSTWAQSVAELARESDYVVTMLPGPQQVRQVADGPDGIIANLASGSIWIDMSTSSPEVGRQLGRQSAAAGIGQLDAPVSGMAKGAEAGNLQIFVGGEHLVFDRARPLLETMGDPERIFHVGPLGAGHTVKLLLNLLWFVHAAAAAEVFVMGLRAGINLETLQRSLVASPANSHFIETDMESIFQGDYDESFAMALVCKDLGLAVDMGRDLNVPVEVSALVEQIHRRARLAYGDNGGEMLAVKLLEDLTGTYLRHSEDHGQPASRSPQPL
ncbi:NAD(P)-dependent oxidoreductase [Ferrimicrobium sp.]|uniref:NAD(P)-dependent oxidoreductase n=1 Tax=Ferrimicrobium sp. TaxID=2926050 RepID=UPI002623F1A5|nr:NAD(P)-dependent oxidoreductase [Ferrimicrobium sp.]MCL5973874.1 NAD(P)-dependent oxidoreductase [Actinomycetota bacterium]